MAQSGHTGECVRERVVVVVGSVGINAVNGVPMKLRLEYEEIRNLKNELEI